MSFNQIAFTPASHGIPVFPLQPRSKAPISDMSEWPVKATTDFRQIEAWDQECEHYNVGLCARAEIGGFCGLEFDVPGGVKDMCAEMGQPYPIETYTNRSGKGFGHLWFAHTERSIRLGNRQAHIVVNGEPHEWFSFRADRRYLVGAGSTHPNGNLYANIADTAPIPIPDWVLDWIEKHSSQKLVVQKSPVMSDDFDIEDFLDHVSETYSMEIGESFTNSGVEYYPMAGCPHNGGAPHSNHNHRKCCFTMGSLGLGFSCFADQCFGVKISDILRDLVDAGSPYEGPIWKDFESRVNVEDVVACIEDEPEEIEMTPAQVAMAEALFGEAPMAPVQAQTLAPETQAVVLREPILEPETGKELQYPELVFPRAEVLYPGSHLEALVSHACRGGDGKPDVLDPGLVCEAVLTLASGLPFVDTMLETRLSRFSVLLAVSRGGKGMAWDRSTRTLGVKDGQDYTYYDPSGHVQMLYQLGDKQERKTRQNPNPTRIPGPRKMIWITEELSGCLKMAQSDGSKVMQQLLQFYDRNTFQHTDVKTGREIRMDCRLSWGTCLAVGFGTIEERKFSDTFQDVSNDGLVGRMFFGFSEATVDSRDLEGWEPPRYEQVMSVRVDGIGEVDVTSNENMASRIAKHVVTGWEPGVFEAYRRAELGHLEFPGWQYALKKTLIHIALVNLHTGVTAEDFRAAMAYIQWQAALRRVFLASRADDDKQARFNERVIRALRKADQVLAKKGKPVEERLIYVPKVAQRHEWALRGKSMPLDKTILELANMGTLMVNTVTDDHGKETRDWQHVRMAHNRPTCWCGDSHPKPDPGRVFPGPDEKPDPKPDSGVLQA